MSLMKLIYDSSDNSPDLFYACKFKAPDPIVYFQFKGKSHLVLNDLEIDRGNAEAKVDKVLNLREFAEDDKKISITGVLKNIIKAYKPEKIQVPYNFPSYLFKELKENYKNIEPSSEIMFYKKRLIKDSVEIKNIHEVMKKTESVLSKIAKIIKTSKIRNGKLYYNATILTSDFLRNFCQKELAELNLSCPDCIIASGYHSSLPHHHGSGPIKESSPIVVDIFPKDLNNGYYGDITRTFCKGTPTKELIKMYKTVLKGQRLGLKLIKAGVNGSFVHKKIEDQFNEKGFFTSHTEKGSQGFIHSTGHGLGLEIHEMPRISKIKEILREGNIVTVEPGLYYSEIGGVRIEDTILVTKTGIKNLTSFPKVLTL